MYLKVIIWSIVFYIILTKLLGILNKKYININFQTIDDIVEMSAKYNEDQLKIEDLVGTWVIRSSIHPVYKFTLKRENIIESGTMSKTDKHKLCHSNNIHCSNILGSIQVPKTEFLSKYVVEPLYYNLVDDEGYKFVLHKNGIIKFVPMTDNIVSNISLTRIDSKSWWDLFKNIKHRKQHGCFCLGIITKDKKRIIRYNRWGEKFPDYFWMAEKIV